METEHFPPAFTIIAQAQADDKKLQNTLNQLPMEYKQGIHHEQLIIYFKNKIVIPIELQSRMIEWYHEQILHSGVSRLIESMKQHFHWKTMAKDITNFTKTCKECQIFKRQRKHYWKLPPKLHDIHPWNQVCVDLSGPWNKKTTDDKTITLLALTIN